MGNERPIPKISEPTAPAPVSTGFSGTLVVAIILVFICGVAAVIYYEAIFKVAHLMPKQIADSDAGQPSCFRQTNAPVEGVNLALNMRAYRRAARNLSILHQTAMTAMSIRGGRLATGRFRNGGRWISATTLA